MPYGSLRDRICNAFCERNPSTFLKGIGHIDSNTGGSKTEPNWAVFSTLPREVGSIKSVLEKQAILTASRFCAICQINCADGYRQCHCELESTLNYNTNNSVTRAEGTISTSMTGLTILESSRRTSSDVGIHASVGHANLVQHISSIKDKQIIENIPVQQPKFDYSEKSSSSSNISCDNQSLSSQIPDIFDLDMEE